MEEDINAAIRRGYFQQVRLLARLQVDVNKRDEYGRTPLMNCALVDDEHWGVGLARTLLEHGARSDRRDWLGFTALHYACVYRRPAFVRVLLAAADFDVRAADRRGNAALHYAAVTGDCVVTAALLSTYRRYQLPVNAVNRAGQTALEFAVHNARTDCVQMIHDAQEAIVSATINGKSFSEPKLSDDLGTTRARTSSVTHKGNGAIGGLTNSIGDRGEHDNTSTALQCSGPAGWQIASLSANNGRLEGDVSIIDVRHQPTSVADGGERHNCVKVLPATNARHRIADRRPHNASCRMSHTAGVSTTHTGAGATTMSGNYRRQGDGSTSENVDELIPIARLRVRPFRLAPIRDPHSRPLLMILHQSAAEFFQSVTDGQSSSDRRISDASNWRVKITRLYDNYGYQFSSFYKPAACARISTEYAAVTDSWSTSRTSRTRISSTSDATQMLVQRRGRKTSTTRSSAASGEGSTTAGASISRKKSVTSLPAVSSARRKSVWRTVSSCASLTIAAARGRSSTTPSVSRRIS